MEYGMEDFLYGLEMEWKKITRMENGKIVFHSIPYPGYRSVRNQASEPKSPDVVVSESRDINSSSVAND